MGGACLNKRSLGHGRTVQEQGPGLVVGGYALQQSQGIAHSIGRCCGELRWIQEGVDRDDFLHERSHDA